MTSTDVGVFRQNGPLYSVSKITALVCTLISATAALTRAAPPLVNVVAAHNDAAPNTNATFELLNFFQTPVFGAPQIDTQGLIGFETNVRLPNSLFGTASVWTAMADGAPSLRFLEGEIEVQNSGLPEDTTFQTGFVFPVQFNRFRHLNNSGQVPTFGRIQFDGPPPPTDATALFVSQPDGTINLQSQLPTGFDPTLLAYSDGSQIIGRGRLPLPGAPADSGLFESDLSLFSITGNGSLNRIATLGQEAPGLTGMITYGGFNFGDVVQTNSGLYAFQQQIAGAGVTPFQNDQVIFADLGPGLTPLARTGDPAPAISGAGDFASFFSSGSFIGEAPSLNSDGVFAFRANNNDADGQRSGIWVGTGPSDLDRIIRTGDEIGTANGMTDFLRFERPQVSGDSDIFFSALTGPDFSNFESTIWRNNGDEFTRLVSSGDVAPGTSGVFAGVPSDFVVNKGGQVAFIGVLELDAQKGITPENDKGLWAFDPDGNLELIVRNGTTLTGQDGSDLGQVHEFFFNDGNEPASPPLVFAGGGSNNDDGRASGLSDSGQIAFGVTLNPDASGKPTTAMIVRASFQGQQPVAEFVFSSACGNDDWHAFCADSNWVDQDGVATGRWPGDQRGTENVRIPKHSVVISDSEVDIRVLASIGTLEVSQQLRLREDSSVENLTLKAKLVTDKAVELDGGGNVWQSGEIAGAAANVTAGTSEVEVASGALLTILGSDKTFSTNLVNRGIIDQREGRLMITGDAKLTIKQGSFYQVIKGSIESVKAITNRGTIRKRIPVAGGADGDFEIEARVDNDGGFLRVESGKLTIAGDGRHTGGQYNVSKDATLELLDGTTEVTAGSSLSASGNGNVVLRGGSYTVRSDATATFSLKGNPGLVLDDVLLVAQGRLKNEGRLMLKKADIVGGTVANDTVTGGIENAAGGQITIGGESGKKTLRGVLVNAGRITQQDNVTISVEGGRIINRAGGEYELVEKAFIVSGGVSGGAFDNQGGVVRAAQDAILGGSLITVPFNLSDNGRVVVEEGGSLLLMSGGAHKGSGTFDARARIGSPKGEILFSGIHSFDGNFRFVGDGHVRLSSTINIDSGSLINSMTDGPGVSGEVSLDEFTRVPILNATDGSFLNRGRFKFIDGAIIGGTVTETGSEFGFKNQGGTVFLEASFQPNTQRSISGGVLLNTGAGTRSGVVMQSADLLLFRSTVLNDQGGVYELQSSAKITSSDQQSSFNNRGGDVKVTDNANAEIGVPFNMTGGNVDVGLGSKLTFSGAGMHEGKGRFTVREGSEVIFNARNVFEGDYRLEGTGKVTVLGSLISEGTLVTDLTGDGKIVFEGVEAGGFNTASATLINAGNAEWKGGSLRETQNIGGTLEITRFVRKRLLSALKNTGTVEHRAEATVTFADSNSMISNSGAYNLQGKFAGSGGNEGRIVNEQAGTFRLADPNATRTYMGTFDNKGTVEVDAAATLNLNGNVTQLTTVNFSDVLLGGKWIVNANATLNLEGGSTRVDINTGVVILKGNGTLSAIPSASNSSNQDFANNGTFELLEGTTFNTSSDFENNAVLRVDSTSELNVNGQFETNDGSSAVINGKLTTVDLDVDGGRFSDSGTIDGQTFNARGGRVGPGNSPGILEFTGAYNQLAAATLEIELGGLSVGDQYDQFRIGGTATFHVGTTIDVTLLDLDDPEENSSPFMPAKGDLFEILVAGSIVVPDPTNLDGLFDLPTLDPGLHFDPRIVSGAQGSEALQLVVASLLGDVNLDGNVNGLDVDPFVEVLLNGNFQAEADMNDDQVVNGLDVDPFVSAVLRGAQQVPEPSTLLLAMVALGVAGGWRRSALGAGLLTSSQHRP